MWIGRKGRQNCALILGDGDQSKLDHLPVSDSVGIGALRVFSGFFLVAAVLMMLILAACGGTGAGSSDASSGSTGRLAVKVVWPDSTRLIPSKTRSVKISIEWVEDAVVSEIATKLVDRPNPLNAYVTETVFNLKTGSKYRVRISAHPEGNGVGTPLARHASSANLTIKPGSDNQWPFTLESTIKTVAIEPVVTSLALGDKQVINVVARDDAGATIMLSPVHLIWNVGNPSVVRTDQNAAGLADNQVQIEGLVIGSSSFSVTERESGKTSNTLLLNVKESSMQNLGTLGGNYSEATGVSADGTVVIGNSQNANSRYRAFRWTAALGMEDLGAIAGASDCYATGVNSDGQVVVGYCDWNSGSRAFKWTKQSGMQDLGTLGGPYTYAYDVSNDGKVVVGMSYKDNFPRATRWTNESPIQELGNFGRNGLYVSAGRISGNGLVLLGYTTNQLPVQYYRWTQLGGSEEIFLSPGGLSQEGKYIVGEKNYRAVRWSDQYGFEDLGLFGGYSSYATCVSANGQIVGVNRSVYTGSRYVDSAILWTATGSIVLGTLGGDSSYARGISDDGKVLVGASTLASGEGRAMRWVAP